MALVTELKKERRNAMLLGAVGVAVALVLVILYFTQSGEGDLPSTPTGRAATQARENLTPTPTMGVPTPPSPPPSAAPESKPAVEPAAAKPAVVKTLLTKKTTLWIDSKPITHGKDTPLEVTPGMHEVKLKLGKKSATQKVEFKAGGEYELRFDPKNEKALMKKLK